MPPPPCEQCLEESHHSCQVGWCRARRWCGSSYSIHRIPSLKFVGHPVPKIWVIFGHGVKRPVTLTFDISTSKWGHAVVKVVLWSRWAHLTKPGWSKPHTHSNPTNLALFGHKITLYRFNQGAHTISGGSNGSRGPSPPHFNHWGHGSRQLSACCAFPFSTSKGLVTGQADRRTDTNNGHQYFMPALLGRGHNNCR